MELAPANLNPFETNRLLQELATYYSGTKQWGADAARVREASTRLITGELTGTLWLKEPDSAAGVAVWDQVPKAGVRVWDLHLGTEDRRPENFTQFLDELVATSGDGEGLFAVTDTVAGVSREFTKMILEPQGFAHVARHLLVASTDGGAAVPVPRGRPLGVGVEQMEGLVALYARAHADSPCRLFADVPLDVTESGRRLLANLFLDLDGTGLGPKHLPWGCIGVEEGGTILGAILATEDPADPKGRACVRELLVDPGAAASRIDHYLLSAFLAAARGHGLREVAFESVVGEPLETSFESAGFRPATPAGERKGFWVQEAKARALGLR